MHWQELLKSFQFPVYRANGTDLLDVYAKSQEAIGYARARKRPCMVVFDDVPRRFGHAATDRQNAYLQQEQIDEAQARNPMEVNRSFLPTPGSHFVLICFTVFRRALAHKLLQLESPAMRNCLQFTTILSRELKTLLCKLPRSQKLQVVVRYEEPKLLDCVRSDGPFFVAQVRGRNSRPLEPSPAESVAHIQTDKQLFLSGTPKAAQLSDEQSGTGAPAVMRKQMTRVFEEQLNDRY